MYEKPISIVSNLYKFAITIYWLNAKDNKLYWQDKAGFTLRNFDKQEQALIPLEMELTYIIYNRLFITSTR